MSDGAIETRGLAKQYMLGARRRERYATLGSAVSRTVAAPFARLTRRGRAEARGEAEARSFWALDDVSFDVRPGEVVGVIGRNGAGKSTLLKILARITEPTRGSATIRGRVGSLLEVGTGFHLELTGRENVYLNGSILGMRRAEIDRCFDAIVAFAEVDRFIDTPVKHYSSGMHLRLAFAVAAHLEPEILLVDEVLAVGDAAFQRKCLGKMGDVAAQGRTILFVSHNLGAVRELCHSSIVLAEGHVAFRGSVVEGLAAYSRSLVGPGDGTAPALGFRDVAIAGAPPGHALTIERGQPFAVQAVLDLSADVEAGNVYCILEDGAGNTLTHHRTTLGALRAGAGPGSLELSVQLPVLWLAPGVYSVYFKCIGRHADGSDVRLLSERALLDVGGTVAALGKALLAPDAAWTVRAPQAPSRPATA
jgi:lipopolysaccharide transport system ATP-binding protein